MKTNQNKTVEQYLPVPMPLGTAPSLIPDTLVLLVRALWGARLGRNRHLVGTTPDRLITVIRGNKRGVGVKKIKQGEKKEKKKASGR